MFRLFGRCRKKPSDSDPDLKMPVSSEIEMRPMSPHLRRVAEEHNVPVGVVKRDVIVDVDHPAEVNHNEIKVDFSSKSYFQRFVSGVKWAFMLDYPNVTRAQHVLQTASTALTAVNTWLVAVSLAESGRSEFHWHTKTAYTIGTVFAVSITVAIGAFTQKSMGETFENNGEDKKHVKDLFRGLHQLTEVTKDYNDAAVFIRDHCKFRKDQEDLKEQDVQGQRIHAESALENITKQHASLATDYTHLTEFYNYKERKDHVDFLLNEERATRWYQFKKMFGFHYPDVSSLEKGVQFYFSLASSIGWGSVMFELANYLLLESGVHNRVALNVVSYILGGLTTVFTLGVTQRLLSKGLQTINYHTPILRLMDDYLKKQETYFHDLQLGVRHLRNNPQNIPLPEEVKPSKMRQAVDSRWEKVKEFFAWYDEVPLGKKISHMLISAINAYLIEEGMAVFFKIFIHENSGKGAHTTLLTLRILNFALALLLINRGVGVSADTHLSVAVFTKQFKDAIEIQAKSVQFILNPLIELVLAVDLQHDLRVEQVHHSEGARRESQGRISNRGIVQANLDTVPTRYHLLKVKSIFSEEEQNGCSIMRPLKLCLETVAAGFQLR